MPHYEQLSGNVFERRESKTLWSIGETSSQS